jgi:hypothetical protein
MDRHIRIRSHPYIRFDGTLYLFQHLEMAITNITVCEII